MSTSSLGASTGPASPTMGSSLPPMLLWFPAYDLDNGVIRIRMNDHAPIITQMWINGVRAVPHDNIGADFQMTARSTKGDGYNPTQGGDCSGAPSVLNNVVPNWNALNPSTRASHGLLFEIAPRNYNEPSYPGCLGRGEILPYDMKFGVTLGDGQSMPKELMVLEMSIRRHFGSSAEPVVKALSELPVIFFENTVYRYAYYSVDENPSDGQTFLPMRVETASGLTHDTQQWPDVKNFNLGRPGRTIMLCSRPDAVENPTAGTCAAIYSHEGATLQASRRQGAIYNLTLITTINIDEAVPMIDDFAEHTQRRLVAVGNPDTVSAAIAWAETRLAPEGWRRW